MTEKKDDEAIVLKIWKWFEIKLPIEYLMRTFWPGKTARSHALVDLSANAVRKLGEGKQPEPAELAALAAAVTPAAEKEARIAERVREAAQILASEAKLLPELTEPTSDANRPSEPWSDRWKAGAGMASDEDVAVMWSRILAGQIRQPGRFSFQTLAVLPEIDRDLAEKFVALSYFLIDGDAVPSWTQFVAHYDAADLPHEWFLRLADARLLNFAPIPTAIAGKPPLRFAAAGRTWRISGSAIDVHMLTRAGQEIASIIDPPKFKPEHASALGSWLVRHHTTVEVAGSDGEFRPWDPRFP